MMTEGNKMSYIVERLRNWETVYECDREKPDGSLYIEAADRIDELERTGQEYIDELKASLNELLIVSKRAVRLSLDYSDFKLYAMEPMRNAITAAEKVMK